METPPTYHVRNNDPNRGDIELGRAGDDDNHRNEASQEDKEGSGDGVKASELIFNDVCVDVVTPQKVKKRLLFGVSGSVLRTELVALMGPSGSGKTTLLMTLASRYGGMISGDITTDNRHQSKVTRRKTALVTQMDLMWESLTVKDTLMYCAELRMSDKCTKKEKRERVNFVVNELHLKKAFNTVVGGYAKPGISGGEKKRVSVALELIAGPTLLLLDEPTSGLDATIALRLVNLLIKQSREDGRLSVLMSIHQPATRIFQSFSKLIVLSNGESFYQGTPADLSRYFNNLGYEVPQDTNPADWVLDVASGDFYASGLPREQHDSERKRLCNEFRSGVEGKHPIDQTNRGDIAPENNPALQKEKLTDEDWTWPANWFHQVYYIAERNIKARWDEVTDYWRLFQIAFVALISGLLWFKVAKDPDRTRVQDTVGLLFFSLIFNTILPLFSSLFAFPTERDIVAKEKGSGWYQLTAYYCARSLTDLSLDLSMPTLFIPIIYFMAGLHKSSGDFFANLFTSYFLTIVAVSIGLLISASVVSLRRAQVIAGCFLLMSFLTAGFFVRNIPYWTKWLRWFSLLRYGLGALVKIQFSPDFTYECNQPEPCYVRPQLQDDLISRNYAGEFGALLIFLLLARVTTYWALKWRLAGG